MNDDKVSIIGGGIAGLTAAAILANEGLDVTLFESHYQLGGCAGTFKRGPYLFDVGATQVAGLEDGGIHERIFRYLHSPLPQATLLDPACLVDLMDGSKPIRLWHNRQKWIEERKQQFPGTEIFWGLCEWLHLRNWAFNNRNPVLPLANSWDCWQLIKALRIPNIASALLTPLSITDLLILTGCYQDKRLRKFLDLQLKLYSQETADRTAALYGATVLQMPQAPLGLWHLQGSMQVLSDYLINSFISKGGKLLLSHRVVSMQSRKDETTWIIKVINSSGKVKQFQSNDVVFSLPPQCLLKMIPNDSKPFLAYKKRLESLPNSSGAIVFFGAINRVDLPADITSHVQLGHHDLGSLFISISQDGDGRSPIGKATVNLSMFTNPSTWNLLDPNSYKEEKEKILTNILLILEKDLQIPSKKWLHIELSTPRSFAKWTNRPNGIVGGLGQHPRKFGLFGLPSRTPLKNLWLCGDSIHPGEGTAGVSQSALMACRQLLAERGINFRLPA